MQKVCAFPFVIALVGLSVLTPRVDAAESKKSSSNSTTSLGDGIFILGDTDAAKYFQNNAPVRNRPTSQSKQIRQTPTATKSSVNDLLVRFCRANLGRKVGNGQCSELAVLGLPASGGILDFNNLWGRNICQFEAVNGRPTVRLGSAGTLSRNKKTVDVRPGDIIQYENVRFRKQLGTNFWEKTYPHHTSVIAQVSKDGQTYKVYEQNVNNTQYVLETTLYMPELVAGTMRISRPIPS